MWLKIGPVVDSYEHRIEPSVSINGREFLDYVNYWQLLKKDSALL
jgi:hypothetical protein